MKKPQAGGGANQLRIIAGRWRSRRIRFLDATGLRPTPDRVRETLFNWLQFEVAGAHCLDAFAGSGALSFEALSRGAASALLIEQNAAQADCLRREAATLAASGCRVLNGDALSLLARGLGEPQPAAGFDLVFLDPPFSQGLVAPFCRALEQGHCLRAGSKVYIETELAWQDLQLPPAFRLYRETKAGVVHSYLTDYEPAATDAGA